ncbi:MAG: hypothetical protein V3R84_10385 [Acidimicrobiia bacterium]
MERRYAAGIAGALFCVAIAYFPMVARAEVPLLDGVDLGLHELGHMLAMGFGRFIHTLAGSFLQIAVPLGLSVYFLFIRRDSVGAGVCAAWAGTSAYDVAIYVADAPFQRLPLIGGYHDWAYLLGPGELDGLAAAGTIATAIRFFGAIAIVAGILLCLRVPLAELLDRRRPTSVARPTSVRAKRRWVPEGADNERSLTPR